MAARTYSKVPAQEQEQEQQEQQQEQQEQENDDENENDDEDENEDENEDERLTTDTLTPCTSLGIDLPMPPAKSADNSNPTSPSITVDEAIERLGMGRFQLIVLTAAGLCFAADAMQVLLLTFLSEILRSEWKLTDDETAFITSILFIGAIFGTLTLGPLADKKGRKPVFLLAASIISIFGVAVAMVSNYWALLANLFMVGWGVGGLTVPFDILAEFLPSNSRGKNLLVIEYFWTVGVLFVVCIAYYTLGNGNDTADWRLFVVICTLPCWFSILIGYYFVPESPRWLCSQGRCEEAMEILRHAAEINGHDVEFLYPEGMQLRDEEEEESNFCELFSPRWRWTTLKLWGAWGFFSFGYYGTIMAITEIFNSEGESSIEGQKNTNSFDYGAIFVSSSAELVGTTVAILSVDTLGRIPLQVAAYAMAGILVCSLYLAAANDAQRSVLIALGFGARIFEMIGSCVSWVSTAEILTTEVRTTGHSAANAVARIGSLFSPFFIEGHSSLVRKGLIMLAIHTATVLFVSQLPETKGSHMGMSQDAVIDEDDEIDDLVFRDEEVEDEIPHADDRQIQMRENQSNQQ